MRVSNSLKLQPTSATFANPLQARRKNIASVRSLDSSNSSRVLITSDVPLNDYAAYWSGDRYYVVIPDADIVSRDIQSMQNSLRGRGYQDVRIERKGSDVVISFRLLPGMRARVEQKFNRLEVVFTPPAGGTFGTDGGQGRPIQGRPQDITGGAQQTGTGRTRPTQTGTGSFPTNTSGTPSTGTGATGTSSGNTSQTGTSASSGGGGGSSRRRGGSRSYGSGGGGGGGGPALNIPLPGDMQPDASSSPLPSASPSPEAPVAISSPLPDASPLSTPAEIAQNQPQQPSTAPPISTGTQPQAPVAAPASSSTGFAAAVRENWLPLLIGLLVLLAIGLLMVSRSRADQAEEARDSSRLATSTKETIKEKPVSKLGAALAGGAAGAATAAAAARESSTKATPAKATPAKETVEQKKETKAVEPVAPAASVETVGTEVKNLLEGKDYDEAVIGSANADTRQLVSTELLAALASRNPERRLRAREAFTKHGFFDDATRRLRTGDLPAVRISAARALGLTQDHAATPHLTAALEDNDAEVRRAAVNALAEIRDPSAIGPLNALLEREKSRKVPHSLIRRAIEASATIDVAGQPAAEAAPTPTAAKAQDASTATGKKDKDDEDREVFEI